MKQIGFYYDQTRCIGCYTCSVACKDWHNIDAGPVNWRPVKYMEEGKFPNLFIAYLSTSCNHCADPPCLKACPQDAITKRESDGIVLVDQEKCLGNKKCDMYCLNACPWDIPQFGTEENAKMQKCNFCVERLDKGQQTICVEACPMYALDAGPLDELREKYGSGVEAEGYKYSERFKPSIILKPKLRSKL